MKEGMTTKDLLDKFDQFRRTPKGNVIIHPNLPANLIELKEDFIQDLKRELQTSIGMAAMGIDDMNATTKFVIFMLEDAY